MADTTTWLLKANIANVWGGPPWSVVRWQNIAMKPHSWSHEAWPHEHRPKRPGGRREWHFRPLVSALAGGGILGNHPLGPRPRQGVKQIIDIAWKEDVPSGASPWRSLLVMTRSDAKAAVGSASLDRRPPLRHHMHVCVITCYIMWTYMCNTRLWLVDCTWGKPIRLRIFNFSM